MQFINRDFVQFNADFELEKEFRLSSGSFRIVCALSENSRRSAAGFHDEYCEPGGGSVYGGAADFGRLFLVEGDHRGTCAVVRYPLYTFYRTIV